MLIKFEDLILQPEKNLITILKFLHKVANLELKIDKNKIKNILRTTSFEYLQNLEKNNSFEESTGTPEESYVQFFKYGNKKDSVGIPDELKKALENKLSEEMTELGYL